MCDVYKLCALYKEEKCIVGREALLSPDGRANYSEKEIMIDFTLMTILNVFLSEVSPIDIDEVSIKHIKGMFIAF